MSIKTVLIVTGPEQSGGYLKLAVHLCEEINAHPPVLVVGFAAPPPIGAHMMVSDAWMQERELDLDRLAKRTDEVNIYLAGTGLSADVTSAYPERAWGDEVIGRRARYADVLLLGPEVLASETLKEKAIEGALFSSGEPLFLAPEGKLPHLIRSAS